MTYLSKFELSLIPLPKWPGCDVDGETITPTQAQEILVRTNSSLWSNNKYLQTRLEEIYYKAIPKPEWGENWWKEPDFNLDAPVSERFKCYERKYDYDEEIGKLPLNYLTNSRVASAYIGGPHGWCNWDGKIHQRGINIGKYPEPIEVMEEWQIIAKAFPYLKLTCRLLAHEAGYEDNQGFPTIAVVYEVNEGSVFARLPVDDDYDFVTNSGKPGGRGSQAIEDLFLNFNDPFREQGCSFAVWQAACKYVTLPRLQNSV